MPVANFAALKDAIAFEGHQMDPLVLNEVTDVFALSHDLIHTLAWRGDEDLQTQWLVHPFFSVVEGLQGEAGTEVACVAFPNSECANDVVQHFVA